MKEKESPSTHLPAWVLKFADELQAEAERRKSLWPGDPLASALPEIARQLEERARAHYLESISVAEAAAESGFSPDQLYRLIKSNRIEDVGTGGVRRIRRADLPRKPSNSAAPREAKDEVDEFMRRLE